MDNLHRKATVRKYPKCSQQFALCGRIIMVISFLILSQRACVVFIIIKGVIYKYLKIIPNVLLLIIIIIIKKGPE